MPIEENEMKDPFDQLVGKKLYGFEEAAPPDGWAKIQQGLSGTPAASPPPALLKNMYFLTAGVLIVASSILFIVFNKKQTLKTPGKDQGSSQPIQPILLSKDDSVSRLNEPAGNITETSAAQKREPQTRLIEEKGIEKEKSNGAPSVNPDEKQPENVLPEKTNTSLNTQAHSSVSAALEHVKKDSVIAANHVHSDTSSKKSPVKPKPKSFYEKQKQDSALKYRKLFK